MTRRRRFLSALALGFATLVLAGPASAAVDRPYEPQYAQTPDYSHLPAEDRAAVMTPEPPVAQPQVSGVSSSGSGFDGSDWMRGIALAAALLAASGFALVMVRGGSRTAHS